MQKGPNSNLVIVEIKGKGEGVIAGDDIARGEFICEYAGEVIGENEAGLRYVELECVINDFYL